MLLKRLVYLYWLSYRANGRVSVVIQPGSGLIVARLKAAMDGAPDRGFREGHQLDRKMASISAQRF